MHLYVISDLFQFTWNDATKFTFYLAVSTIPVVILGLFFEEQIDALFHIKGIALGPSMEGTVTQLVLSHGEHVWGRRDRVETQSSLNPRR